MSQRSGPPFALRSDVLASIARFTRVALCIAAATTVRVAGAQSSLGPERRDINDLRGDIWAVWSAPAHMARRDVLPTIGVVGGLAVVSLRDSSIYTWMSTHPNSLAMKLIAPVRDNWRLPLNGGGNGQFLLPLSGVLYASGRVSHDADLRDAGLGCAAAHLSSAALRDVIYLTVYRTRPHDTAHPHEISLPGGKNWSRHSFLSGHIANSMACVSYLSHRFSLGVLEPAMYGYVSMIGLGRMADGWHWTSDTMAGAAMGFAIGKAMSDRQFARASARARPQLFAPTLRIPVLSLEF
jgi:hypothetical protein